MCAWKALRFAFHAEKHPSKAFKYLLFTFRHTHTVCLHDIVSIWNITTNVEQLTSAQLTLLTGGYFSHVALQGCNSEFKPQWCITAAEETECSSTAWTAHTVTWKTYGSDNNITIGNVKQTKTYRKNVVCIGYRQNSRAASEASICRRSLHLDCFTTKMNADKKLNSCQTTADGKTAPRVVWHCAWTKREVLISKFCRGSWLWWFCHLSVASYSLQISERYLVWLQAGKKMSNFLIKWEKKKHHKNQMLLVWCYLLKSLRLSQIYNEIYTKY